MIYNHPNIAYYWEHQQAFQGEFVTFHKSNRIIGGVPQCNSCKNTYIAHYVEQPSEEYIQHIFLLYPCRQFDMDQQSRDALPVLFHQK